MIDGTNDSPYILFGFALHKRESELSQNKQYILIASAFLLINAILITYLINTKNTNENMFKSRDQIFNLAKKDFTFNTPSPDFSMPIFGGKKLTLSQWRRKVIIIRFSKFYLRDLPWLVYLEHLASKFQGDVKLIFVNRLGKHDTESISKFVKISAPIIEDDGYISSLFNVQGNETIIVGKDFRIKFKSPFGNKWLIYNQVLNYVNGKDNIAPQIPDEKLAYLIKKTSFKDIKTGNVLNLGEISLGKKILINQSISPCMTCPENSRIRILKNISKKIPPEDAIITILFGIGNREELVNDYLLRMELNTYPIIVGIIERGIHLSESEYYQSFQLDVDPRILVLNKKGDLEFLEEYEDANRILKEDFLIRVLRNE